MKDTLEIFVLITFLGGFTVIGAGFCLANSIEAKESRKAENIMLAIMLLGLLAFFVGVVGACIIGLFY